MARIKSDEDVLDKWNKCWPISRRSNSKQWDSIKVCQEFYVGDSMSYVDRMQYVTPRDDKKRALIQFNKVMPFVDAVNGFMAQNRREVHYLARVQFKPQQDFYTRHANAVKDYVRDKANAAELETEQDLDMLVGGIGVVETDMSYIQGNATTCPNGEIIMERLDPRTVFFDPMAKRKNISDARWVGYWKDYDLKDALALFPKSKDSDFEQSQETDSQENYYYDPYGGRYDKVSLDDTLDWVSKDEQLVRVYNFQWYEFESFWQADNPIYTFNNPESVQLAKLQMDAIAAEIEQDEYSANDLFKFDPTAKVLTFDAKTKAKLLEIFGKFIVPVEFKRKCFYTAVVSGKHVFSWFKSVCQTDYSVQFKTGTFDPIRKIWIGMVSGMMEPQLYYNKALTELMFTIASNSKGGVLVEEDAVEDIEEFEQKYAATSAVISVKPGANTEGKIKPKGQNIPMTGLDGVLQLTDAAISDTAGIDKAFLGTKPDASETGLLFRRRIRQVVSTLAKYFDAISLYQKNNARLMLDYIRVWSENNEGVEVELLEDDGSYAMTPISRSPFMAEYAVTLMEKLQSPEDKEELMLTISALGDKVAMINPTGALKLYAIAAKSLNTDASDKAAIVEALTPQGEQIDPAYVKQLEQQVQLLSSKTNEADVKAKLAKAELDMARIPEIQASIVQKRASAAKTLEEAQRTDVETCVMQQNGANATVVI